MNYYIDTEYLNGKQDKTLFGFKYGETKPLLELISIAIVSEDNREFYAISKDFNLKEAWNRFEWKQKKVNDGIAGAYKDYWIRENVLRLIFDELKEKSISDWSSFPTPIQFTYKNLKKIINKYGKTNQQIAKEIKEFITFNVIIKDGKKLMVQHDPIFDPPIQFYGYYSDFDYVVFSQLFGGFENYPAQFLKYFIDLKQIEDEINNKIIIDYNASSIPFDELRKMIINLGILPINPTSCTKLEDYTNYPKSTNIHNALEDAQWNKRLHKFIKSL